MTVTTATAPPVDDKNVSVPEGHLPLRKKKILTLVFIFRHEKPNEDSQIAVPARQQVLLGLKKRGFGHGLWNGFGGKVNVAEESIVEGAQREVHEECGINIPISQFERIGILLFHFPGDDTGLECHVFCVDDKEDVYFGKETESEEMRPEWVNVEDVPFGNMWKGDSMWWPVMLEGKLFAGRFWFGDGGAVVQQKEVDVFERVPIEWDLNKGWRWD
ncbi:NUDIX hydrolase domain-like protein [Gaertneriomyces semiglobifer]|nr:NUDIX hydrolase domain-like protein [Gaertneriomyces semiglobifer]